MAYVYILKCSDDSYYTGIASEIKRRIKEHYTKAPACAKYTRARDVVELSAVWETETLSKAGKLEYYIKKKLTHKLKERLVNEEESFNLLIPAEISELKFYRIRDVSLKDCL